MEDSTYEQLRHKYRNMEFKTTPKLYFEAALAEIDLAFNEGFIPFGEWNKLLLIICEWEG